MESNHAASTTAQAVDIVPFWNRLREISTYPMHSSALLTIVVLALCHLVRFLPFGGILDLLVWVAMYKYAFECLRASADGRLEPPEVSAGVEDSLGWKQIWLQAAFIVMAFVAFLLGPVVGLVVLVVLGLSWPGAIMSLAMDQNLGHALNPATWMAIFARIGWPYLALVALYFVFFISQSYAQAFVAAILPAFLAIIVVNVITNYVIVATFHLMGYLIYQYHAEVGYEPAALDTPMRRLVNDPDQEILEETAALVQDGQPEAACDLLGQELRGRGGSEAAHAQYRKLLAVLGRRDEQLRHGREWIGILLAQDKDRRAVDVVRECVELDPAFELSNPDDVARIAQKAVDAGATQVALKLVSAYLKKHPKHKDVPQNSLLAAKVLAERMGKDDIARKLLDQVSANFPNHPLAADVAAYRQFLDKIAAPTPPRS